MRAFLLQRLYPTGWRTSDAIFWRVGDAARESARLIAAGEAGGVRVLSVRVNPEPILENIADAATEGFGDEK